MNWGQVTTIQRRAALSVIGSLVATVRRPTTNHSTDACTSLVGLSNMVLDHDNP